MKNFISTEYNIKELRKVKTIIRWQIGQDTIAGIMKINQSAFIWNLVIEKGLTRYNANIILIKAGFATKMTKPKDYKNINFSIYQWLISKLIYLIYGTRPDITFVIGQLNKYNVHPRRRYLQVKKRVVWYLCETKEIRPIYGQKLGNRLLKDPPPYDLIDFVDYNFIGDSRNCKLMMRYCFFLNRAVISWYSKK